MSGLDYRLYQAIEQHAGPDTANIVRALRHSFLELLVNEVPDPTRVILDYKPAASADDPQFIATLHGSADRRPIIEPWKIVKLLRRYLRDELSPTAPPNSVIEASLNAFQRELARIVRDLAPGKRERIDGLGTYSISEAQLVFEPDDLPVISSPVSMRNASRIDYNERDHQLFPSPGKNIEVAFLPKHGWGVITADAISEAVFRRYIDLDAAELGTRPSRLLESVIPFPSAPMHGLSAEADLQFNLANRRSYHSLRVLKRPTGPAPHPCRRIYLLHNGLNELDTLDSYYRLADLLLRREEEATGQVARSVCILRPFPGHLTRHPFSGVFAEKPMDRYLIDGTELFRQFLRFMLETHWLLSALLTGETKEHKLGLALLLGTLPQRSVDAISEEIAKQGDSCRAWSQERVTRIANNPLGTALTVADIRRCLVALNRELGLPTTDTSSEAKYPAPQIHAVGYSLGGFVAQSVFFTWPQVVATCTMLNSGGSLEGLQLSGFAHPEEWQRVLHLLRCSIDSAAISGAMQPDAHARILGIEQATFATFLRRFNEVFLQEFQAPYKSMLHEYNHRLLFLVGGSDPVVTPESVIKRAPESGINLVEVANLAHGLHGGNQEWREFWFPEVVARVIHLFAIRAEATLAKAQPSPADAKKTKNDVPAPNVPLNALDMARELNEMCQDIGELKGWLLVARNFTPEEFLGAEFLRGMGISLHSEESELDKWEAGRLTRGQALDTGSSRVFLVLPVHHREHFGRPRLLMSPYHDPTRGLSVDRSDEVARHFENKWVAKNVVLAYDANRNPHKSDNALNRTLKAFARLDLKHDLVVNTLPDTWLFISPTYEEMNNELGRGMHGKTANSTDRDRFLQFLNHQALAIADDESIIAHLLSSQQIRLIRVSRGGFNPRFRGLRVWNAKDARRLLLHTVWAAYNATVEKPLPGNATIAHGDDI